MGTTQPVGPLVRLRDLRNAHNMTMAELARRIGDQGVRITVPAISNVENGHKRASDRLLAAWAKALSVSPLDVWQGPLRPPATRDSPTPDSPDPDPTKVPC